MTADEQNTRVELSGEIVETFEKNGARYAKIVLKPCHLELTLDAVTDLHLGDEVAVEASITIECVRPAQSQ